MKHELQPQRARFLLSFACPKFSACSPHFLCTLFFPLFFPYDSVLLHGPRATTGGGFFWCLGGGLRCLESESLVRRITSRVFLRACRTDGQGDSHAPSLRRRCWRWAHNGRRLSFPDGGRWFADVRFSSLSLLAVVRAFFGGIAEKTDSGGILRASGG